MVRLRSHAGAAARRSLRAGGGGSSKSRSYRSMRWVSPRRRRWFVHQGQDHVRAVGLSAQAEVVRRPCARRRPGSRSLRAGGGGSDVIPDLTALGRSLRAGGRWFVLAGPDSCCCRGLSAQAEVVRTWSSPSPPTAGVSPRTRRWFELGGAGRNALCGLSAQAEVVRCGRSRASRTARSLRAGEGGSASCAPGTRAGLVSPRRRRWSGDIAGDAVDAGGLSAQAEVVR